MGIFKKIGKGIKKVFKKIGKGIKKVFRKIGDLGILGTIALSFILGPAAGFITGKLGTAASALMTKGAVAKGMGHVITAATKVASIPGNVFKTVTDGVMGFVQQVGGEVLKKMGFKGAAAQSGANVSKAFRGWAEGAAESARKNLIDPFTMSNKDYAEQLIAQSQPAANDALKEVETELKAKEATGPEVAEVRENLGTTDRRVQDFAGTGGAPTTEAGTNIKAAADTTTVTPKSNVQDFAGTGGAPAQNQQSLLEPKDGTVKVTDSVTDLTGDGTDSPYRYSANQKDLINPLEPRDPKTGKSWTETFNEIDFDYVKNSNPSRWEAVFNEMNEEMNKGFFAKASELLSPKEWMDKFKDPEWRAGAGDQVMEAARKSTGKVFETAMVQYALGGGQGVDFPKTGTPVYGQAQFLDNAYTQAGYNYGGTPANYYVGQAYQNMQPSPYGDVLSMGLRPVGRIA